LSRESAAKEQSTTGENGHSEVLRSVPHALVRRTWTDVGP
jgi:hypothetical protein